MRSAKRSTRRAVLGFVAASALVLGACGGDSADDAATEDTAAADAAASDKPFEGVTLKFGKAPHGEDEKDNWDTWLGEFTEKTGIKVELTQVPWDQLEALYTANFASDEPYDVTYQTSAHLTLFGEQGAFEDVTARIAGEDFAADRPNFPEGVINASVYNGKLYGLPFVVGTTAMFVNKDMFASAGVEVPTSGDELKAAAKAIMDTVKATWRLSAVPPTRPPRGFFAETWSSRSTAPGSPRTSIPPSSSTVPSPATSASRSGVPNPPSRLPGSLTKPQKRKTRRRRRSGSSCVPFPTPAPAN
jgi:ABC-type glycerol-3-phosphate transport system substrate-binding protein